MRYDKSKIKDHEIPGLIFFMDQLLRFQFRTGLDKLTNREIQTFLDEGDSTNVEGSLSLEPVKKMLDLTRFDNLYRPLYTSIEFLLELFSEKKIEFKDYVDQNIDQIEAHFALLEYTIQKKNPERNSQIKTIEQTQTLHLSNQTKGIQINLDEGLVSNLLDAIAFRFGNLLSEEMTHLPKLLKEFDDNRTFRRLFRSEQLRQINSENIIAKAVEFAKSYEPSEQEIDQDWISEFFNISQDCSNEKMQYLWAKILASQIDKPDSFSRRALNGIKLLNSEEASLFSVLCNCLWVVHPGETRSDRVLIKNSDKHGYYSDATWGFDGNLLRHLEDLGLVHETFMVMEKDETYNISFFGKMHEIATKENALEIELVRLSTVGAEIYDVVMTEKNDEYYKFTIEYLSKINILKK